VIGSYSSYDDARRVVEVLAKSAFPPRTITIVGHDVEFVEDVVGTNDYRTASVQGAVTGAFAGAAFGAVLAAFSLTNPLLSAAAVAAWGIVLGGVAGVMVGLVGTGLRRRGKAAVPSVRRFEAETYDVVADETVADEAQRALRREDIIPIREWSR